MIEAYFNKDLTDLTSKYPYQVEIGHYDKEKELIGDLEYESFKTYEEAVLREIQINDNNLYDWEEFNKLSNINLIQQRTNKLFIVQEGNKLYKIKQISSELYDYIDKKELIKKEIIDLLIYNLDDTKQYSLSKQKKEELKKTLKEKENLSPKEKKQFLQNSLYTFKKQLILDYLIDYKINQPEDVLYFKRKFKNNEILSNYFQIKAGKTLEVNEILTLLDTKDIEKEDRNLKIYYYNMFLQLGNYIKKDLENTIQQKEKEELFSMLYQILDTEQIDELKKIIGFSLYNYNFSNIQPFKKEQYNELIKFINSVDINNKNKLKLKTKLNKIEEQEFKESEKFKQKYIYSFGDIFKIFEKNIITLFKEQQKQYSLLKNKELENEFYNTIFQLGNLYNLNYIELIDLPKVIEKGILESYKIEKDELKQVSNIFNYLNGTRPKYPFYQIIPNYLNKNEEKQKKEEWFNLESKIKLLNPNFRNSDNRYEKELKNKLKDNIDILTEKNHQIKNITIEELLVALLLDQRYYALFVNEEKPILYELEKKFSPLIKEKYSDNFYVKKVLKLNETHQQMGI